MRDYHTAENCRKADGTMPPRNKRFVESDRFYLADADFLVSLEGDHGFLKRLDAALRHPVWPLFLGRKAFVPSLPVCEGVSEDELIAALTKSGWRKRFHGEKPPDKSLRGVVEVPYGTGEPRADVPLSFVSRDRRFGVRYVKDVSFSIPPILEPLLESAHVSQQAPS
jgi:CRISPR system Cascade subunit CasD